MKMAIDGSRHTGLYSVDCECGGGWTGVTEKDRYRIYSPALPIAECVAHVDVAHPGAELDVRFNSYFQQWLMAYWERVSLQVYEYDATRGPW